MAAVWTSRHEALVSNDVVSPDVCPPWWSLIAGRCSIRETPRGQQGTPALTLPHLCDGLRVLLMAVLCPCRRPSLCRPVHRRRMRNALLDLTTVIPTTPCH